MSNSIDSKVVEMKFDNRDFEANVKNTISTLDRLKDKLKFKGAETGFNQIQKASDKVDFSGISNGLDVASVKFSALQVAGITAISNITNSLMGLAKNLINTFAIKPRSDGFAEYELKMGSVQTIMASTGASIDEVNGYLDELNTYSDKTIYSFSDMTNNIGKFTNAGVNLKDAVKAIQGVSNEAAVSGANANEASRAMYNFAQALSAGAVKLIDWKSIENANMATVEFKNQLISTALELGTLVEENGKYISTTTDATGNVSDAFTATSMFNDSLSSQWMTTEVLIKTLGRYADENTEIGAKAFKAAQEVKTFSMMMDTLEESAGSGWAQTFELIFGNFNEATEMWTNLTNKFDNIIQGVSNARNNLLKSVMYDSWDSFAEKVQAAGLSMEDFQSKLTEIASSKGIDLNVMIAQFGSLRGALQHCDSAGDLVRETLRAVADSATVAEISQEDLNAKLNYFQDVVDRVWRGDFKNAPERYQLLADAGYDYAKVQELVNKTVDHHRLTLEDLGDEQLQAIGYTQEEINQLHALADEAAQTGSSLNDLIDSLGHRSGRDLIFNTTDGIIENLINTLLQMGTIVKDAWSGIFEPIKASSIVGVIETIQQATYKLYSFVNPQTDEGKKHVDELVRTLKGLVAIIKIITTFTGGALRVAFKLFVKILEIADVDILSITASVGDAIVAFEEWLLNNKAINTVLEVMVKIVEKVIEGIKKAVTKIGDFTDSLKIMERLQKAFSGFYTVIDKVKKTLSKLTSGSISFRDAAKEIVGAVSNWYDKSKPLNELFGDLFDKISKVLEPLKKFMEQLIPFDTISEKIDKAKESIGNFVTNLFGTEDTTKAKKTVGEVISDVVGYAQEYLNQLQPLDFTQMFQNGLDALVDIKDRFFATMTGLQTDASKTGNALTDFIQGVNWEPIFSMGGALGALYVIKKLSDGMNSLSKTISNVTKPFSTFDPLVTSLSKTITKLQGVFSGVKFTLITQGILNLALAIGVMAVALRLIGEMPIDSLIASTIALTTLIIAVGVVASIASKVSNPANAAAFAGMGVMFAAFGLMLIAMAASLAIIAGLPIQNGIEATAMLGTLLGIMAAIIFEVMALSKKGDSSSLVKAGSMFKSLGVALVLMAAAVRIAGSMDEASAVRGTEVVICMVGLCEALVMISSVMPVNKAKKLGDMFKSLGVALVLMVSAVAIAGKLNRDEMDQGLIAVTALGLLLGAIISVIASNGPGVIAAGGTILAMSFAIGILVGVSKLAAKLSPEEFQAGAKAIGIFGGMMSALVVIVSRFGGGQAVKCAGTIAALSIGIAALVAVAILCGYVDTAALFKGVTAVGILGLIFAAIMAACKGINAGALNGAEKSIVAMSVVIAAMTVCAILLGMMDTDKCIQGVASVSAMCLVFSAMIRACGSLENVKFSTVLTTIIIMVAVVAAMTGVVYALSGLDSTNALPNTIALSILLLAFAASMKILDSMNGDLKVSGKSLAEMAAVTAALAVVLALMSALNVQNGISNAIALGILINAFAASLKILSTMHGDVSVSLVTIISMTVVTAALALILAMMSALDVQGAIPNALALSTLLIGFSAAIAILSAIGPAASFAMAGIGALLALIVSVGGLMLGIGELNKMIPDMEETVNSAIPILGAIGSGLGTALGNFVGGALEGLSDHLPGIADNLSSFFVNLDPMFKKLKSLAGMDFSGIDSLASAITKLAAADLLEGISSIGNFFGGNSPKEKLEKYADALVSFSNKMEGVNTVGLANGVTAAKMIKPIMEAMPTEGGLKSTILGSKSEGIDNMSQALPKIGAACKTFANSVKDVDVEQINSGVNAVTALSKIMKLDFPTEGGLAGVLFGSQSEGIANMSSALPNLGKAAKSFADNVVGIDSSGVESAVSTLKSVTKLSGNDNFKNFQKDFQTGGLKTKFSNLGEAAANFGNTTAGGNYGNATSAVNTLKNVGNFVKEIGEINTDNVGNFVSSINKLAAANVSGMIGAFQNAGQAMVLVGTNLMKYLANGITSGKSFITAAVTSVMSGMSSSANVGAEKLITSGKVAVVYLSLGVIGSGNVARMAMTNVINGIYNTANSAASKFRNAGSKMMNELASGIRSNAGVARNAASSALNGVANSLHGYYGGFYDAGLWCATGLANGISAGVNRVTAAARNIAHQAVAAAEKEAGVGSPAKKFIAIGRWCVIGLRNGLRNNADLAGAAGKDLSKTVIDSVQDTINLLDGFDNFKMGYATLTPVIDSRHINGLNKAFDLSTQVSNAAVTPLKSSVSMMQDAQKAIEISNGKVITAIESLDSRMGEYTEEISNTETAMYVDGKKLASSIAKPMNQQLGILSRRGGLA